MSHQVLTKYQRRRVNNYQYKSTWSGTTSNGWLTRKWPGVRASHRHPQLVSGLKVSISASIVVNSSNVSLVFAMTFPRCVFRLLTAASQRPSKWGVLPGMNLHSTVLEEQKSAITSWFFLSYRNSKFLQFSSCSGEVSTMIAPKYIWMPMLCHEPLETS